MRPPPLRLLTIAGSDSGGGAGIQADLKTFAAHGAYGMSAITSVTAQNTRAVTAIFDVSPQVVAAQIDAVFDDIGVDAVKIGMLASAPIVRVVAERLAVQATGEARVPIVLDPVMVAKSGDALLASEAIEILKSELLPLATLVTPNLPEAARLTGGPIDTPEEREAAARSLHALGPAVLIKGGHLEGSRVVDLLLDAGSVTRFDNERIATRATHGTGCTLSSAIAVRLAAGEDTASAVAGAIAYLRGALEAAFALGGGVGPVNHLYALYAREAMD
jgi:hydroxymethylpyrimidine/phosphomethylpyrimidine kinase